MKLAEEGGQGDGSLRHVVQEVPLELGYTGRAWAQRRNQSAHILLSNVRKVEAHTIASPVHSLEMLLRAQAPNLAMGHDGDPRAQKLGLVHHVRAEHERRSMSCAIQNGPNLPSRRRVEPGGGFIQKAYAFFAQPNQRDGDRQAPLHSTAQRASFSASDVEQTDLLQHCSNVLRLAVRRHALEPGVEQKMLLHGQTLPQHVVLRAVPRQQVRAIRLSPHVVARDPGLSRCGTRHTRDARERGRLARSILTQNALHRMRSDHERQTLDCFLGSGSATIHLP
mmetsp:Transcript_24960/g.80400  ORF Transcript_24960/g.80400 Transcript_24960/m.80400 type:complete len:280 (-) Transcript_24960:1526-2365(-)